MKKQRKNKKIKMIRNLLMIVMLVAAVFMCVSWTMAGEKPVMSGYYGVDGDNMVISGIAPGTSQENFLSRIYYDKKLNLSAGVATGSVLSAGGNDYTLAVTGDINGDGRCTITDVIQLKKLLNNVDATSPVQKVSCDANGDNAVTIADFVQMKAAVLGKNAIMGHKSASAQTLEGYYSIVVGETIKWTDISESEVRRFSSVNPSIVSVDENGTMTAVTAGTTIIRALLADRSTAEILITVENEPVGISLDTESVVLEPEDTYTVTPTLSRQPNVPVEWASGDEAVATVDKAGIIRAVATGETEITASLANGNSSTMRISVMRRAESIGFEKEAYLCILGSKLSLNLSCVPEEFDEDILWSSSDESIAGVSDGTVTGNNYGTVTITAETSVTGRRASCTVSVEKLKQIAITFDDGPGNGTERLLDYLASKNAHATFFMVINRLHYYPGVVKKMVDNGNEIGYHSYSHNFQTTVSLDSVRADYEKSQELLLNTCGKKATVWRSPGGYYNQDVLNTIPLPHIMWSVDTVDWAKENQNAETVRQHILSGAADGEIVLLHDLYETTVDGAIAAIEELINQGYELVTVSQLISRTGNAPQASVTYRNAK